MVVDKKKRGRPKKDKEKKQINCKECEVEITDDDNAIECDICKSFVCLDCTGLTEEVFNYLVEKEADIPHICKPCKAEIPRVRELMGLKKKYNELTEEITKLKADLATQDLKFANQDNNMKALNDRLTAMEAKPTYNPEDYPNLLEANQPQQIQQFVQHHVRPVLQTEISEYDRIQAIRKNLVCSGIKESNSADEKEAEVEDKAAFINLIKDEFNIVADVEKVERCGKKVNPTEDEAAPRPRLLKVFMRDQRTRKQILSKAVTLRDSPREHTKQQVFIRPDQTPKQQADSKNLRDQLKLKRQQNREKTFKIYRGKIIEVQPEVPAQPEVLAPPDLPAQPEEQL